MLVLLAACDDNGPAENQPPQAPPLALTTAEDTPLSITLPGTDSDGFITYHSVVTAPVHGTLEGVAPDLLYIPDADFFGSDSFVYRLTDNAGAVSSATVSIEVTAVNDAPVAVDDSYTVAGYTSTTIAAPGVLSNDSDIDSASTDLTTAAATLDTREGGTVTMAVDGGFTYTPPSTVGLTEDSFEYTVSDNHPTAPQSATARVTLVLTDTGNQPPLARDLALTTSEDTSLSILLQGEDADGVVTAYSVITPPTRGRLSGAAPAMTYTPAANYFGSDSFVYGVTDNAGATSTATVTITITPVNDAPVALDDSFTVARNKPTVVAAPGVLANDSDIESAPASLTVTAQTITTARGGSVNLDSRGGFIYSPPLTAGVAEDSFQYTLSDNDPTGARFSTGRVTLILTGAENQRPTAVDLNLATPEDQPLGVTLRGEDGDGVIVSYAVTVPPTRGRLTGSAPNLTYTPQPDYFGDDSFTYRVTDDVGATATGTVRITVSTVNDAPTAAADSFNAVRNALTTVAAPGVLANDSDIESAAATLTVTATTLATAQDGVVTLNADGGFTYTPPPTAGLTTDSFQYTLNDNDPVDPLSATGEVTLILTGAENLPPSATDLTLTTAEDSPLSITLQGADSDGAVATYTVTTPPQHGRLTGVAPDLTYTPDADYFGSDSFVYEVTDSIGAIASATVTLTVNAVNDAPTAAADSFNAARNALTTVAAPGVLANDSDIESTPAALTVTAVTLATAQGGAVTLNADGGFTYTPPPTAGLTTDSFQYTLNDNDPVDPLSATGEVTLILTGAENLPPSATDLTLTTAEDSPLSITLQGTDSDGAVVAYTVTTPPQHGQLAGVAPNLIYTPAADYFGSDSFVYEVTDSIGAIASATVTLTINAVNDAPTAAADSFNAARNTLTTVAAPGVLANDSDIESVPAELTVTAATLATAQGGAVTLNADGGFTYTPPVTTGLSTDSFQYTLNDNDPVDPLSATGEVTLILTGAENLPPSATDLTLTTAEDSPLSITLQGADSDGAVVAYTVTTPPQHGQLAGVAPNLTYTPAADYFGSDSFIYAVTDNLGATASATVALTISAVNDAPTAVDDDFTAQGNIITLIAAPGVLANDSDVESADADLTATAETIATDQGGSVTINTNGSLLYTPPPAAGVTADSFHYTLNDNDPVDPRTSTGTVTIALTTYTEGLSVQGLPAASGDSATARLYLSGTAESMLSYQWSADGSWVIDSGQGSEVITLTAPAAAGAANVSVVVEDDSGNRAVASLPLSKAGETAPVLESLYLELPPASAPVELAVTAYDPDGLALDYTWKSAGATVASGATAQWQPPLPGRYQIDIEVDNSSLVAGGSLQRHYTGGAPWAFFRGSRQGTGVRIPADTSSNSGALKWQRPFTMANCAVADNFVPGVVQGEDGTLYAGSSTEGKLYAFNPDDGVIAWSFTTVGTRIDATPVIAEDGSIYVVESGGTVYAVNADGSEKWSYAIGAPVSGSPAIGADGTVYVGTDNGGASVLLALNPADGLPKWSAPFALAAETRSSVNIGADGTVYARDFAGNLFAINPADGTQRWQITLGGGSGSTPVIAADGTLYFGSFSPPRLYAVGPDGSPKWDTAMGNPSLAGIGATPSVGADGTVYVGVWEAGLNGSVYAIDPVGGTVVWRRQLDSFVQSAATAVGADGRVYVVSARGVFYALDPDNGAVDWSFDIGAATNEESPSPLAIGTDGSIYVYTCDGVLRAFQ
ncbi:Ig-like domain-containing protein [Exilibacterium tricleocarpae]|nr:Ig-like domain-containing protein [Exilibacterium tricleocarpae]